MVDLIKITPERIETRNSSGHLTFSTDINYIRTDPAGDFRVGGINRAPAIRGGDSQEPYTFFDNQTNQGHFGLISRSSDVVTPGVAWEAQFYVPADPTATMGLIVNNSFPTVFSNNVMGAIFTPSSHNAFLDRRPNPSEDWIQIASGPLVYLGWAILSQPNAPPLAEGREIVIGGIVNSFDYPSHFLQHRGNYFRLRVPSNWHTFNYVDSSGFPIQMAQQLVTYYAPSFSIPQQTLALSVTP